MRNRSKVRYRTFQLSEGRRERSRQPQLRGALLGAVLVSHGELQCGRGANAVAENGRRLREGPDMCIRASGEIQQQLD